MSGSGCDAGLLEQTEPDTLSPLFLKFPPGSADSPPVTSLSVFITQLKRLIAARATLVQIVTYEEERAEQVIAEVAANLFARPVPLFRWTSTEGLCGAQGVLPDTREPIAALDHALGARETAFFLFEDLAPWLGDPRVIRRLRDVSRACAGSYTSLFLIGSAGEVPHELHRDVAVLDLPLPETAEIEAAFDAVLRESTRTAALATAIKPELRAGVARAALGLTQRQAAEAFRKALAGKPALDDRLVRAVTEEKRQLVRRVAALDFMDDPPAIEDVGGLDVLKGWLEKRRRAIEAPDEASRIAAPKGLLLTGVSGCGKSLACKVVARHWGLPLLRFNMASLYETSAGSPEDALALTIRIAETVAPCVLWIDEIEAGVSTTTQKAGQGSASRVLASLLNWMQEKKAFVFVAATANVIELLPPEVLRKGRFDEIFFVGLPRQDERLEIFRIHLRLAGEKPEAFDIEALAKSTNGWNGAEIEQVVTSARVECLSAGRSLTQEDLVVTAGNLVPLSVTMREEIGRMERWAHSRAVQASGTRRD